MNYLELLTGTTGFINGDSGLDEIIEDLHGLLKENGRTVIIIDNLYYNHGRENLNLIKDCDNIVIYTQALYWERTEYLIKEFLKLKYVPKKVLFILNMHYRVKQMFQKVGKNLQKKGTKFYLAQHAIFEDEDSPIEINWLEE